MAENKEKFIEKFVKKDYNNELEKILENKIFEENAKSILLSILYKIEASYKDVECIKRDIQTKDEYIAKIVNTIDKDCENIKVIKMTDNNCIPEGKTYLLNKEEKEIIAYPIERKILYAIAKIGKRDKIIKDTYFIIDQTLSDLINVGNNIEMVEPLRDFNGYSWTTSIKEIESIDHNLIYQNLRILIGYKFLEKWIYNNEFIIDYFDILKNRFEEEYGKTYEEEFIESLMEISILLDVKYNKKIENKIIKIKRKLEDDLEKIQDKGKYIKKIAEEKKKLTQKIMKIDAIINDKKLLQHEYKKRNEKLPLESKIFSIKVMTREMIKEKEKYFRQIEKLNELVNPKKYIKHKKRLEEKYKYLRIVDEKDREEQIDKLKIQMQKTFLHCLKSKIENATNKQQIIDLIYEYRYYLMIPYNYDNLIYQEERLTKYIKEISEKILDKAIELKVIEKISDDKDTNYNILRNIFNIKVINLEDVFIKITKEKNEYFLQILDESITEEKFEIEKPKDLQIKLNKKISIWC